MFPYRRMLDHLKWADQRVLASLAASPPSRAIELYAHVLAAEHVWLSRIRGRPPKMVVWPNLTRDECGKLAEENGAEFDALLSELDGGGLDREITYTTAAGMTLRSKVEDILVHVSLHGSYHRGQVALLLRMADVSPASTDYIAFVRGVPVT